MVDVKATLYDGSYHEVDSNEMAFKIAGSMAFKEAARKASPVLLEPVMSVEVVVPEEFMGTIIGDGALRYRPEAVMETYYAYSSSDWSTVTLDYQLVVDPGYNADRGPVSIFALRLHAAF